MCSKASLRVHKNAPQLYALQTHRNRSQASEKVDNSSSRTDVMMTHYRGLWLDCCLSHAYTLYSFHMHRFYKDKTIFLPSTLNLPTRPALSANTDWTWTNRQTLLPFLALPMLLLVWNALPFANKAEHNVHLFPRWLYWASFKVCHYWIKENVTTSKQYTGLGTDQQVLTLGSSLLLLLALYSITSSLTD